MSSWTGIKRLGVGLDRDEGAWHVEVDVDKRAWNVNVDGDEGA